MIIAKISLRLTVLFVFIFILSSQVFSQWTPDLNTSLSLDLHSAPPVDDPCAAYNGQIDRQYEQRAQNELDANQVDLRQAAIDKLNGMGIYVFQLQRVQVSGILSGTDDDNVDQEYGPYFDHDRIALSYFADEHTLAAKVFLNPLNFFKDFYYLNKDRSGEFTQRSKQKLGELSDTTINELYAHSWATEAVYNAILQGTIRPPRKLVLMGLPSHHIEKWYALARATGSDISIYGYEEDPYWPFLKPAWLFKSFPQLRPTWLAKLPGQVTNDPEKLAELWNAWVVNRPYPPWGRRAFDPAEDSLSRWQPRKSPDIYTGRVDVYSTVFNGPMAYHYRDAYYKYLKDMGVLIPVQYMQEDQEHNIMRAQQMIIKSKADELRAQDPPPPCPVSAVPRALPAEVPPPAPERALPDRAQCLSDTLQGACDSHGNLAQLPFGCAEAYGHQWLLTVDHHSIMPRWNTLGSCGQQILNQMTDGGYSLETINKLAGQATAPPVFSPPVNTRPSCHTQCAQEEICGPITYVNRNGFDFPRQSCAPRRQCQTVCD